MVKSEKCTGVCANALLFHSSKKTIIMMMKCDHTSNYDNGGGLQGGQGLWNGLKNRDEKVATY